MERTGKTPSTRPGSLIAVIGIVFIIGAAVSPMPDALGGWLLGGIFILAAIAMLRRPVSKSQTDSAKP